MSNYFLQVAPRYARLSALIGFAFLVLALIFGPNLFSAMAAGTVLSSWGFEGVTTTNTGQTPIFTAGSPAADSGDLTSGSTFTGFHTSASTAWSNPAGNGSLRSVSTNNWSVGDYYQFSFSTAGYSAISITWDQTGSATGPRDFKIQYSTDGSTFTDASGTNSSYQFTTAIGWSTTTPSSASTRTLDLSAVTALDNQPTVYIRLVDTSTTAINGSPVATGGTGRVDNFSVSGTAIGGTPTPTPTPSPTPPPTPTPTPTPTPSPSASAVVISQVYGGGGNSGATYTNDFVELFNRSNSTVSITGWSVQYASATGTGNFSLNVATLSGSLSPGQYYLVQLAGGATGVALPTPDATQTGINMGGGAGKIVLVNSTTGLTCNGGSNVCSGSDLAQIIDLVGWGNANFFEGAGAASGPSNNTTSIFRANGGCTDSDNNSSDFSTAAVSPRNTSSATNPCGGGGSSNPSGTGTANPSSVQAGASTLLTVNVTPGANPTSTSLAVVADLSSIGGSATQSFSGSGNSFTFNATVSMATSPGIKNLPFTITDAEARSGNGSINLTVTVPPPDNNVVISQVYGGGGNTGATLTNDYIELINRGSSPISLNGWSVQAFVSTTGTWQVTPLTNFTLQPGQYYLIQESQGAGGTDPLPTPDAVGTIPVSSTSTKVALLNNTTQLTVACPASSPGTYGLVDLVGYGGTDCWEGTASAPLLDNLTANFRRNDGCFDTNDNAADFMTGEPNPRNSSAPTHSCSGLFGYGSANPTSVLVGNNVALAVHVLGGQNPPSTGVTVTADLSAIGGSPAQLFGGGGNLFSFNATVALSTTGGFKSLPVTITDAQARSFNTNIVLSVLPLVPEHITISQIYGGGGNTGAIYRNDFVELYNPTGSPVTVNGWSIQYASATGSSWVNKQPIGGIIGPGEYLLVALASGGATGATLPPSQISGSINMSGTAGKVALVKNSDTLPGLPCPLGSDPDIVDFVGYGSTANCHEGSANTPAPSNTTAILRKLGGGQDTDQNGNDFVTGAPNPRQTAPIVELGPWVAGTDPGTNGNTVPHDATVAVDFSEAVTVDPNWFSISCVSTGLHNDATVAHTNDFKTYAITPNTNFQFGEQCTVTLTKTAIHDQDTDDSAPDTDTLIDDYIWSFTVVGAGQAAPYPPSVHLTMGDPGCNTALGCAASSTSQENNYLMDKPTYALSYNRNTGTPNWVSWHLEPAWYGTLARVDTFRPDPQVPADWYRVQAFDYAGSGFDRGHMTPNADRDNQNRVPINQETYLMSNMIPQSPDNNQGPWAALEGDLRTIADGGNELYIVSGPQGVGGTGSNGSATTIANGNVTVPAFTWKVALVLPKADGDDVSRVTCASRTIAVLLPNIQGIRNDSWQTYLTTVDNVEQQTGLNFFANVPPIIQACIEAGINGTNLPGTADQYASTIEDSPVGITLNAASPLSNPTFTYTYSQPGHGTVTGVGPNVTYTPTAGYFGPDSFTFSANDGQANSNTSTVFITVNEKTHQTITFGPLADKTYGDPDFAVNATASSGLPVSFSIVSGPATILGNVVHITGAGTVTVRASQSGDSLYKAAPDVDQSFEVNKATPSFSNLTSPIIVFGTATTNLGGTLSFGSLIPTGSVAITLNGVTQNAAIQAGGNFSSNFATASLTPMTPPYSINYTYAGDGNFNSAAGTGTLTVGFGIQPLYDQTKVHKSGSTIAIKLAVIDANGANISSPALTVTAVGITMVSNNVSGPVTDAGEANPDDNFRYDNGSYVFNLKTDGLVTGIYNLTFVVGSDPTPHTVQFQIK